MSDVMEFVELGGKKFRVIKTGRAQAEQVVGLTRWLSNHGAKAFAQIQSDGSFGDNMSGMEIFIKFLGVLDTDAVMDLFVVLIGCSKEDAEIHFDIAIMVDVAIEVYQRQTSLRRLLDRFFSQSNSESTLEEQSTKSE